MNANLHVLKSLLDTHPHPGPELLSKTYSTLLRAHRDLQGLEKPFSEQSGKNRYMIVNIRKICYETVLVSAYESVLSKSGDFGNRDQQRFKFVVNRCTFNEPKFIWEGDMVKHVTCAAEDTDGSVYLGGCGLRRKLVTNEAELDAEGFGDIEAPGYEPYLGGILTKISKIVPFVDLKSKACSQEFVAHIELNKFFYLIKPIDSQVELQFRGTRRSVFLKGEYPPTDQLGMTSTRMVKMDNDFIYGLIGRNLLVYDLKPVKSPGFEGSDLDYVEKNDWQGVPNADETYQYRDHCMNAKTVFLQFPQGIRSFDKKKQQFTNQLYLHDVQTHGPLHTCACNGSHVYSGNRKMMFLLSTKLKLLSSVDVYANSEEPAEYIGCRYMRVFKFEGVTMAVGVHSFNDHYFVVTNFGSRLRLIHAGYLDTRSEMDITIYGVMYSRLFKGLLFFGEFRILMLVPITIK